MVKEKDQEKKMGQQLHEKEKDKGSKPEGDKGSFAAGKDSMKEKKGDLESHGKQHKEGHKESYKESHSK